MGRLSDLKENMQFVWQEEGPYYTAERLLVHGKEAVGRFMPKLGDEQANRDLSCDMVDVFFINGCDYALPHPIRYRVFHQAEQLESIGISTRICNAWELNDEIARLARVFVIFRCPYSDVIEHFINLVHSLNKKVFFDIDDLVIDTKYTDQIPFVAQMDPADREGYDDGVRRYGQTLTHCDGAITTTNQLADELRNYVKTVFVNRNVASEEMYYLSNRAVYERDVLPNLTEKEVDKKDRHRWKLARERKQNRTGFSIGYFSGSITHNPDFEMILPVLVRFMSEHDDVHLSVVGHLDLPESLLPFEDRITRLPFSSWRRLPQLLSFCDVNLIPLEDTVFNRAKSENKWTEAALVKVPSIASNTGALADVIEDGKTGLLCDTPEQWFDALQSLYLDKDLCTRLAKAAYDECVLHHLTCGSGAALADFVREQQIPNVAFVLPSLYVSGGIMVAIKHAVMLHNKGFDVSLLSNSFTEDGFWYESEGIRFPVLSRDLGIFRVRFDKMIATMWSTVPYAKYYANVEQRYYLVQNLETGFYPAGDPERGKASATYGSNPDLVYCTISTWCKDWLEKDFRKKNVRFAPNGIDLSLFKPVERDWTGKIRILIEGDSESEYKNVDESFAIINKLDHERFEIWYLSYNGEPKASYHYDKFLHAVPHAQVGQIYQQCHILLKTSVLESFSYPPLEMIATGGAAVVLANDGNAAYLVDGKNCLLFDQGEDDKAAGLIERIVDDEELRAHLREEGLRTAESLAWDNITEQIVDLYR